MNRASFLIFIIVILTLLVSACSPQAGNAQVAQSDKLLLKNIQVNPDDMQSVTQGNTAFALDLYRLMSRQDGNLFFSPYSISSALAMTYAGASGTTADQMAQTLHFTLPPDQLHPALNTLAQDLATRPSQAGEEIKTPFELSIANALWGQQDYKFLPEYLDLLAQYYGAGIRLVDFRTDAEGSRQQINQWVSDQTKERIKDLIAPGALDEMTRLVLTNAIYFKAGWLFQFEKESTITEPFHLLDGTAVEVATMHLEKNLGYALQDQFRVLELPYESGGISMLLVLPDEGQFGVVESRLTPEMLTEAVNSLQYGKVNLALPKFKFESEFKLNQALIELGMTDAFQPDRADFSGMTSNRDLFIGNVVHKAFVAVDETGTEAAAATAVIMATTAAMPDEPIEFRFDRPFIFLIRDNQTGSLLFIGRVLDPDM
jgi:serpin B